MRLISNSTSLDNEYFGYPHNVSGLLTICAAFLLGACASQAPSISSDKINNEHRYQVVWSERSDNWGLTGTSKQYGCIEAVGPAAMQDNRSLSLATTFPQAPVGKVEIEYKNQETLAQIYTVSDILQFGHVALFRLCEARGNNVINNDKYETYFVDTLDRLTIMLATQTICAKSPEQCGPQLDRVALNLIVLRKASKELRTGELIAQAATDVTEAAALAAGLNFVANDKTAEVQQNFAALVVQASPTKSTLLKGQTGYIWIGNYSSGSWSTLKITGNNAGATTLPTAFTGQEFSVNGNMVLRKEQPEAGPSYFRGIEALGVVPNGTRIRIEGNPIPYLRGSLTQYWAKVTVLD